MKFIKHLLFALLVCLAGRIGAQSADSLITISGAAEIYYTYDFNNPDNHTRPGFIYSLHRHNEINLNLGYLKAAYATDNVRANLAFMAGTYANVNLAAEPGVFKNVYEANAGIRLSKTSDLWLDAGIFASHIGFESAYGGSCWNLTRSILADNSPYYESGVKLSYTTANGQWFFSVLVLNGWQRIHRIDGNHTPAGGWQVTFKPTDGITLNSSSFFGNDFPDNVGRVRAFHNFYAILQLHEKVGLTAGFDYGQQQIARRSDDYHSWYSPVLILRITPTDNFALAGRVEYYSDEDGVIIATGTPNGFQTYGYSVNFDFSIGESALLRFEGRAFESEDQIFILDDTPDRQNYMISSALTVSF